MKSTTRFKNNNKGIECLNCKQPIATADNFCSNCGQVNDTKPLSLKQYISELLGGFFAFDTRTINTIIPLLFKPGKVSKAYIKGERMKYVNPFKLYLHTTILFFLITGVFLSIDKYSSLANKSNTTNEKLKDSITNEVLKNTFQVNDDGFKLRLGNTKLKDSIKPKILKEKINTAAKLISKDKKLLKKINDTLLIPNKKDSIINIYISNKINKYYKKIKKKEVYKKDSLYNFKHFSNQFLRTLKKEINQQNSHYTIKLDSVKKIDNQTVYFSKYDRLSKFLNSKTKDTNKGLDSLGYEKTTFNLFLYKKAQEAKAVFDKEESIRDFGKKIISKSSLVMFFMLPLFTLFLSLIYIRRKYNYTEHLIFVFNIQTVFFILLLIGIIFDRILGTEIGVDIALLLFLFYLYKAMRKFYNQGRVKTILKFLLLNFAYLIFSIFGFVITTFLAFLM